jgi:SAM-dependent methyltransferase
LGEYLRQLGWISIGIDIIQENAAMATQRGVLAVVGDLSDGLPFKNCIFDAIVAKQVIEHLINTRLLLTECYRTLRPKGCLLLSTPNLSSLSNRLRLLFGMYPHWMDFQVENGVGHIRYYTLGILKQQLHSVGFKVECAVGTALVLPLLARFLSEDKVGLLTILGKLLPQLSPILIIKARKF